jgi:hypothetical protein
MSRKQNLRWKRKAIVVAAVAASFAGFAAVGTGTASAGNYGEWDCSDTASLAVASIDDQCTVTSDEVTDDSIPNDTIPVDSVPVDTDPVVTDPGTTQPTEEQAPPTPPPTVLTPGVPGVTASGVCATGTGTIELVLSNTGGQSPVSFLVTHPVSGTSSTVVVPVGSSQQMTLLGTGLGTVQVSIVGGDTNLSRWVDVTCEAAAGPIAVVAPQIVSAAPSLPVTGPRSALPTAFIAVGLLGAGSVALAFARRNSATKGSQS